MILGELVRDEKLHAKPEQVKAMVQEIAQTYEQPDAVVRWHFEKPERLAEFEALAVEHNVVEWVLAKAKVTDVPTTFEALMGPARALTRAARAPAGAARGKRRAARHRACRIMRVRRAPAARRRPYRRRGCPFVAGA